MQHNLQFRSAALSDIPELVRLRLAYFEEEFGTLPAETLHTISKQLPAYFAAHLNRGCYVYAAALQDGTLAANSILCCTEKPANPSFPNGKSGLVLGVYTMPEYRGNGCATALMQMLLADAKRLELDIVKLSASDMGKPIYEKLGFRIAESHFTEMEYIL